MTDDEGRELGQRALKAGYLLWRRMVLRESERDPNGALWRRTVEVDFGSMGRIEAMWPDFRDAATLGTLVAQVRERWGRPRLFCRWVDSDLGGYWHVNCGVTGATEAEAWVAALEARPLAPAGEDE